MNGGTGSATFNLNHLVAVVADIGAYQQGNVQQTKSSLIVTTYLFGPRISAWKNRRLTLFGESLWGIGHATPELCIPLPLRILHPHLEPIADPRIQQEGESIGIFDLALLFALSKLIIYTRIS